LVAGATLITLLDHPISAGLLAVALIILTLALVPAIRKRGIEVLVE
jgi:putative tricarboxylic transport membrane protein